MQEEAALVDTAIIATELEIADYFTLVTYAAVTCPD